MQNVTGGTSPLPAVRLPAADATLTTPPAAPIEAAGELGVELPAVEQPRDTGSIGTGASTTGARPSALSLPGLGGRGRTGEAPGEPPAEPEGAGDGLTTLEYQPGAFEQGSATYIEVGSTSTGTSKGSTGSRGTRSC